MEEDYSEMVERITGENKPLLSLYTRYLKEDKNYIEKTMELHVSNIDFFSHDFLINYEGLNLVDGISFFDQFLGRFFIRKCMWSNEKSMKEYCRSFVLLFDALLSEGLISKSKYDDLQAKLKEQKPLYLIRVKYYNSREHEFEDLMTDWGEWNDEYLLELEKRAPPKKSSPKKAKKASQKRAKKTQKQEAPIAEFSTDPFDFKLILSAKMIELLHMKQPDQHQKHPHWSATDNHWVSCWKVDLYGSTDQKGYHNVIATNAVTYYSIFFTIKEADILDLEYQFHKRLMETILRYVQPKDTSSQVKVSFAFFRGIERTLTGVQTNRILDLDYTQQSFKSPQEVDEFLNSLFVSAIDDGFPQQVFERYCHKDSPFGESVPDNIVPFSI